MTGPRTVPPSSADTRPVPPVRIRLANDAPVRPERAYVLYWMVAARRARANFALQRAVELAVELAPAADRLRAAACRLSLGERPPARLRAAGHGRQRPGLRPDAGALLPLRRGQRPARAAACSRRSPRTPPPSSPTTRRCSSCRGWSPRPPAASTCRARSGRRQRPASAARGRPGLPDRVLVSRAPAEDPAGATSTTSRWPNPLAGVRLPPAPALDAVLSRWPRGAAGAPRRRGATRSRACRSITTSRRSRRGAGPRRRSARLEGVRRARPRHLRRRSPRSGRSADQRPVAVPALRPHLGARGVRRGDDARGLDAPEAGRERRRQARGLVGRRRRGAEAFLDQLVTWRELGFNAAAHLADHDRYDSLPAWARATLDAHARDPRPHRYDRDAFERAATHDPLWNAAQTPAGARRPHPQLPAHAVGQEDPRVVAHAAGRARHDDRAEQQVRARRPRSRTPTAASSGAWAATIGRGGRSARSSGRCAT